MPAGCLPPPLSPRIVPYSTFGVLRLFAGNAAGKPVVHEPCFITESTFAPGKHTIEIEMGEPWQDHDNFIPLSHLITY